MKLSWRTDLVVWRALEPSQDPAGRLLHSFICGQNINIKLPNVAVAQFKGFFPPIFLVDQVPSIKKYAGRFVCFGMFQS